MCQVEVSHKSEMADPFNMSDTKINNHFKQTRTSVFLQQMQNLSYPTSDVAFGCYLTLVLASL